MNNAHRELLFDRILHLLECENTRLRHAAKNSKNFVSWLDDFYKPDYENFRAAKFGDMAVDIMQGSVRAAQTVGICCEYSIPVSRYSLQRHAALLEACSDVTKDELPSAIEKLINSEPQLVAQGILASALGGHRWDSE